MDINTCYSGRDEYETTITEKDSLVWKTFFISLIGFTIVLVIGNRISALPLFLIYIALWPFLWLYYFPKHFLLSRTWIKVDNNAITISWIDFEHSTDKVLELNNIKKIEISENLFTRQIVLCQNDGSLFLMRQYKWLVENNDDFMYMKEELPRTLQQHRIKSKQVLEMRDEQTNVPSSKESIQSCKIVFKTFKIIIAVTGTCLFIFGTLKHIFYPEISFKW